MSDQEEHFVGKIAQKAVIVHNEKVLFCRGAGDSLWELPGGRLNHNENPDEGLKRELLEELGIVVDIHRPIHVCRSLHAKSNTWRILIAYKCSPQNPQAVTVNTKELDDVRWVPFKELHTLPLFDDCREVVDIFLQNS